VRRGLVVGVLALTLIVGAARAALFRGTDGNDRLVGTARADTIYGLGGQDVVDGRAGPDVINPGFGRDSIRGGLGDDAVAAQDGAVDTITCGHGNDVVTADPGDKVAADCETVTRQIGRDTTTDFRAQHETQVEPDSFSWNRTVVAAFQNGRIPNGGAAAIGWATSRDAGKSWRSGVVPLGTYGLVSDPVVAYDAKHETWLIAGLGAGFRQLDIWVSRSKDGLLWSQPIVAAGDVDEEYDKEWLACDNGARSKFRGSCYLAYVDINTHWLALRFTRDGGLTWSKPVRVQPGVANATFTGPMPVVQPDGTVVVPYSLYAPIDNGEDRIAAVISEDGGETYSAPLRIARLISEELARVRAPSMPSVDVDAGGRLYVVWQDSRERLGGTENDIVLSTSANGRTWTSPRKIPMPASGDVNYWLPAIGVEPSSAGKTAKLAVAYYSLKLRAGCEVFLPGCAQEVQSWVVQSADGGDTWTRPRKLNAEPMRLEWIADSSLGRMLGDYISVSWAGGKAIPVIAIAGEPTLSMAQAVFAPAT
jgi:BNR repeat-like domain/RTX calcium-binding nonapeptide repeat (4 copies)